VSHSLVAGVLGSGVATAGIAKINQTIVAKVLMALAFSPILGFIGAFILMVLLSWALRKWTLGTVTFIFGKLQIISAAFLAYSHGKNDAQNAVGIMALGWAVYYSADVTVETWMQFTAGAAIGIGTALGGWRVINTLGTKITKLNTASGFTANVAAAAVIEAASSIGLPVSTTHTSSSAIVGVGATSGMRRVRFGVIKGILSAWAITYPFCFALGWILSKVLDTVLHGN